MLVVNNLSSLVSCTSETKTEKVQDSQRYKDIVAVTGSRMVPEWLEANIEALSGTVKQIPTREMIDVPVDEMLIVELYSK